MATMNAKRVFFSGAHIHYLQNVKHHVEVQIKLTWHFRAKNDIMDQPTGSSSIELQIITRD
jgi:hypothetical protein